MAADRYIPSSLGPPRIFMDTLPGGYSGTQRTAEHIKQLIRSGARDYYLRQRAIDILLDQKVAAKDYLGEIKALFGWVQRNIRYTKDPFRVEVLHSARRMLELRAGDCDDMTILLGSMLEAIGHPVRLVLAGPDPKQPRLFSHIYLEVYHNGYWLPLDPTMPNPMGWAPGASIKQVITIERRPAAVDTETTLRGSTTARQNREALEGLIRGIRREGLTARDPRVRTVWELLRRRQLLSRSSWLKAVLRRIWRQGLSARRRPRTTQRLVRLLTAWGLIPQVGRTGVIVRPRYVRPVRGRIPSARRSTPFPRGATRPIRQQAGRRRAAMR